MKIYILTEIKEFQGERTDPVVKGATTDVELAMRWNDTTSYIHHQIHETMVFDSRSVKKVISEAESIEKEREKDYGE